MVGREPDTCLESRTFKRPPYVTAVMKNMDNRATSAGAGVVSGAGVVRR